MKVALVHDWLTGMRGGEKVLEVFCELFPDADLWTLVHVPGAVSPRIEDRRIHVSPLNRVPGIAGSYRNFLPLFPYLIGRLDFSGHDLVLSTSSCVAKGARPPEGARHVSYVHSPMRYIWDRYDDYFGPGRAGGPTRAAMSMLRGHLQRWDRESSDRVDRFIANSEFVAARIRRYYGRESEVIHPPVDLEAFRPAQEPPGDEWLVVSAFAPYKRIDVAIEAAARADVRLAVVGRGPEEARLRELAGPKTRFLGWVSDEELAGLYARCRGLLFPAVEDFGIAPVEALASGRPVLAYARGGARETVVGGAWEGDPEGRTEGATGLFVPEQSAESFAKAIRAAAADPARFDPADCRQRAEEFSREKFRERIRHALEGVNGGPA